MYSLGSLCIGKRNKGLKCLRGFWNQYALHNKTEAFFTNKWADIIGGDSNMPRSDKQAVGQMGIDDTPDPHQILQF